MNAVLYTNDLEPITVVRVSQFLWDRLARGETVHIPIIESPSLVHYNAPPDFCTPLRTRTVRIYGELLHRKGSKHLMLFTHDDENALALRAEFLPGQNAEVQRREKRAFAVGFIDALMRYQG